MGVADGSDGKGAIIHILLGLHITSFYEFLRENIIAYYVLSAMLLTTIGAITIMSIRKEEVG